MLLDNASIHHAKIYEEEGPTHLWIASKWRGPDWLRDDPRQNLAGQAQSVKDFFETSWITISEDHKTRNIKLSTHGLIQTPRMQSSLSIATSSSSSLATQQSTMDLRHKGIREDQDVIAIAEEIKTNKFLIKVDLSYNYINGSGVGVIALADAIKQSTSLTTLVLSCNMLGYPGVAALTEAIKQSKSLVTVDLRANHIGDVGATTFADAIKQSTSLTTVNLSYNMIGYVGALALASAIAQSTYLATVNLNYNPIGDVGAIALADAIKQSTSLTTVNMAGGGISSLGALALAAVIKQSKSLVTVELRCNPIGDNGEVAIAIANAIKQINDARKQNSSLDSVKEQRFQEMEEGKNRMEQ